MQLILQGNSHFCSVLDKADALSSAQMAINNHNEMAYGIIKEKKN